MGELRPRPHHVVLLPLPSSGPARGQFWLARIHVLCVVFGGNAEFLCVFLDTARIYLFCGGFFWDQVSGLGNLPT